MAVDRLPELAGALELPVDAFTLDFGRAELWPGGIAVVCPLAEPSPMLRLRPALAWHVANGFALVQSMPAGQAYRVLQRYGTSRC